eukprot:CAMPEP_0181247640 /NCGR_PEP_ID=MMETSP1096-20121128/44724_1 /TAXON_ID=156174 ORGANISM="Chrysochromulina ericina, Strain CCMP281" /NCGR_SAMPLE_ID=MMETSP1096 /ASSEMBLY_ACC=CAM_ASM_000453 /LENGTH=80 /DNA_ID=CAMNT_0023344715 /DNA_START=424 /DNA_END=666 /DNA_ORIENTATION=+
MCAASPAYLVDVLEPSSFQRARLVCVWSIGSPCAFWVEEVSLVLRAHRHQLLARRLAPPNHGSSALCRVDNKIAPRAVIH